MRFQPFPVRFTLFVAATVTAAAAAVAVLGPLSVAGCRRLGPPRPTTTTDGAGGAGGDPAAAIARAKAMIAAIPPAPAQTETTAARGTVISLLYAANFQGEYEHCGCPSHPLGGLVRRATVIDLARAQSDGVLVVDAGDMLMPAVFHDQKMQPPDPGEVERRARLILTSYARMGVHAVLPAERDLAIGPARLAKLLKATRVPAVASNLVDARGHAIFPRDRIVTVAGIPIGIFGVVAPQPEDAGTWTTWNLRATDPEAAARDEVASLRARGAKMIVALLHLGPEGAAAKLLKAVPGVTWAVQGHAGWQLETPETVGGARLLDAMSTGKLAGRLDVHVVGDSFEFSDRGQRAQLLTIIADHRQQLADLAKRASEDKTNQLQPFFQSRQEGITKALRDEIERAGKLPAAIKGSWFENRIIPLDESVPDQTSIALLVAAYNAENARRAAVRLPVGIGMVQVAPAATGANAPASAAKATAAAKSARAAPKTGAVASATPPSTMGAASGAAAAAPATPAFTYAGSAACAACHQPEWKFFQATKHAHALASLASPTRGARRDRDPTCVGCHSTGFTLPGGTTDIHVATDRLKDVGCESCHGPGLAHVIAVPSDKKTTTHRLVPETTCRGCHTPDQTNGEFNYEAFRKAILGPGHGA